MRRQGSTDRLGRHAMLVVVTLVLILPISTVSRAGTFTFPVQSEQAITGTTTGLGGAQTDDGVLETLRESDTTPDSITAPATQTLTMGTMVGGTFPADIQTANDVFVQYRETSTGGQIKAVQNGAVTLGSAATSVNATLSPAVDLSKSFLVFGTSGDTNTPGTGQVSGQIANANTVTFQRDTTAVAVTIEWYVAEFLSGVSVQRGSRAMAAATENVAISGVTLSRTFALVSYRVAGITWGGDDFVKARLTSATNLQLTINAVPGANAVEWQVVDFTGANVQTGEVSFATTDSTKTAALSPTVDPTRSWLILSYMSPSGTGTDIGQKMVRGVIIDGSTLTFDRVNTGQIVDLTWFVVEFTDGTTVERNSASFSTTETLKDVAVGNASNRIVAAAGLWNRGGRTAFNTDDNPGVASVTMDLTSATNLRLTRAVTGSQTADVAWYVVSFSGSYQASIRYDWSGVPAGDSYLLSVKGYRGDEDFNVQVLTPPSTWTTRITVNSLTNQLFSVSLTLPEYNGGGPQVRFVDALLQDGSVSDLFLDRVSVNTVRSTYSLEVRHNITGITAGSNPILVVKGNITAGGENFYVHVWNFASASWNLLMAAPFTPTNAYHNSSLAADDVSGGTVRVRYVDAASQDASSWVLSLDFVAVVITNDQATLTSAGVSPASGYITTSFTFFVRYSDPENDAPAFVSLTLDGISYAMVENNSADMNYVDGKDYFLNRVTGILGTFNYSFSARASAGDLTLVTTPVQQLSVLNRAPNISNPVTSDAVHTGRSYVRDFNGTDPDGDTLAWSASTNASWLTFGSANGTVWGVAPPDIRSFYANLSVSDGLGGFTWLNYTLSVGNLLPSITTVVANMVLARRASFSYDMNASDPDLDLLIWSLRTNASFLAMDPSSGTLSGIASSVPSSYWIEVTVSDAFGGIDFRNFSLVVANRPPAIFVSAPSTAEAGASYSGSFSGTDPDDDQLAWSLTTNATWLLLDAATGQLYGTPSPGTYFANLSGRDPYGGVSFQNFTITVRGQSTTPPLDSPPGLQTERWTFSLIFLLFGVIIAIVIPRRRPIIESAFLIDLTGRVRLEFAIPGTPYDEGRLQSTLKRVSWRGLGRVSDSPYTLHMKPDPSGDWIFVSRASDSSRVMRSAEKLISKMQGDVTSHKKPRLSERSS